MGTPIEINDTLKLKTSAEFPKNIRLGEKYPFTRPGIRLFHIAPTRVFLVEEKNDGKWNYVGHALITEQTIDTEKHETRGIYQVLSLYSEEYQKLVNQNEPPEGKRTV